MGLLQHSPRRITKPYTAFCETKKSHAPSNPLQKLQTLVARSRWPWPGPGGPVPLPSRFSPRARAKKDLFWAAGAAARGRPMLCSRPLVGPPGTAGGRSCVPPHSTDRLPLSRGRRAFAAPHAQAPGARRACVALPLAARLRRW